MKKHHQKNVGPAFPREAMKVAEAAEALGVSQTTVRRLIRRGSLRPCRALRHVLIPVSEVRRLLGQQS